MKDKNWIWMVAIAIVLLILLKGKGFSAATVNWDSKSWTCAQYYLCGDSNIATCDQKLANWEASGYTCNLLASSTVPLNEKYMVCCSGGGGSCTPDWNCGAWGTCSGGTQTKTCTDLNYCGTNTGKPVTSQSCTSTPQMMTALDTLAQCNTEKDREHAGGLWVTECSYVSQSSGNCNPGALGYMVGTYTYFSASSSIPGGLSSSELAAFNCLGQPSVISPTTTPDCVAGQYRCVSQGGTNWLHECFNGAWSQFDTCSTYCFTTAVQNGLGSRTAAKELLCPVSVPKCSSPTAYDNDCRCQSSKITCCYPSQAGGMAWQENMGSCDTGCKDTSLIVQMVSLNDLKSKLCTTSQEEIDCYTCSGVTPVMQTYFGTVCPSETSKDYNYMVTVCAANGCTKIGQLGDWCGTSCPPLYNCKDCCASGLTCSASVGGGAPGKCVAGDDGGGGGGGGGGDDACTSGEETCSSHIDCSNSCGTGWTCGPNKQCRSPDTGGSTNWTTILMVFGVIAVLAVFMGMKGK